MDKTIEREALQALERQSRRYKRQNEWNKNNYDRQTVTFPKGTKERIKTLTGESINGYVNRLVQADLDRLAMDPEGTGDWDIPF